MGCRSSIYKKIGSTFDCRSNRGKEEINHLESKGTLDEPVEIDFFRVLFSGSIYQGFCTDEPITSLRKPSTAVENIKIK